MSIPTGSRKGFLALVFGLMAAAAILAVYKENVAAVITVVCSAVLLLALFIHMVSQQRHWKQQAGSPFPQVGRSGAPKSRQTHLPW